MVNCYIFVKKWLHATNMGSKRGRSNKQGLELGNIEGNMDLFVAEDFHSNFSVIVSFTYASLHKRYISNFYINFKKCL